jgi:hypothetical protein
LITTDGGLVSIDTDPNVVIVDNISFIFEDDIGIRGCIAFPNGKMIFVDNSYNNKLLILNDDGTLDKEIRCSLGDPFDVTGLYDTTVFN